jgi:hypothetical protein
LLEPVEKIECQAGLIEPAKEFVLLRGARVAGLAQEIEAGKIWHWLQRSDN